MVLGHIGVQKEESCSLDSLAKILRRIAPQDDIVLLTNIPTKGDNLNRNLTTISIDNSISRQLRTGRFGRTADTPAPLWQGERSLLCRRSLQASLKNSAIPISER